uniref:Heavy metal transport/detoxification protein n=1 Tax=Cyanothece sp. (strain PCC 7425 / ATCC 29141) TaxID=395961 RepID=B8HSC3_CYAP4
MELQLRLSHLVTHNEATDIKETILVSDPEATVTFDFQDRMVMVNSQASAETIRQLITATGYRLEEFGEDSL